MLSCITSLFLENLSQAVRQEGRFLLAYERFPCKSSSCWMDCYTGQPGLFLQHNSISTLKAHDILRAESTEWKQQAHPHHHSPLWPMARGWLQAGNGAFNTQCSSTRSHLLSDQTRLVLRQSKWWENKSMLCTGPVRLIALRSISLSCSRGEWTLLCVEIKHDTLLENKSLFL